MYKRQAQDKQRVGDKYTDDGFIVTNEFGHYFEQKTFKDYYDRLLKDADIDVYKRQMKSLWRTLTIWKRASKP